MSFNCPYCNKLQKAFEDHNYCSNRGDEITRVKSNAFYMNSNQLYSGKHISRLSIRSVLNGYQYYKTGGQDRMVKKDNYLITNQGQQWSSEIESEQEVEMVVVAFHPEFIQKNAYSFLSHPQQLLDNPFYSFNNEIHFLENTYPSCNEIQGLMMQLKKGIVDKEQHELFYEQIYFELLDLMLGKHQELFDKAELIPSKKKAVREELFIRLGIAKDYMDANLTKKISLEEISKVAALSSFHFLRLFKALYKTTPYKYLTGERMKYARYLVESSSLSIEEICYKSGFENPSSFGRLFKSFFKNTPLNIRKGLNL